MSTAPVNVNNKRKLTTDDQIPSANTRKQLRVEIPLKPPAQTTSTPSATTSHGSLFSATSLFSAVSSGLDNSISPIMTTNLKPAMTTAPPITGLYFIPSLEIPHDLANSVTSFCFSTYFTHPDINQIMLFTRFTPESSPSSSLPPILLDLLNTLSSLLKSHIPDAIHTLLFPDSPTQARQVILNLYTPGEGISPHVDLLNRFGDGIIGVSLGSGCVMNFTRTSDEKSGDNGPTRLSILDEPTQPPQVVATNGTEGENTFDLYLPERSVLVLSSDARYKWTHGIEKRKSDFVALNSSYLHDSPTNVGLSASSGHWIGRGIRLSVTFRWLLPGADVVGDDDELSPSPAP